MNQTAKSNMTNSTTESFEPDKSSSSLANAFAQSLSNKVLAARQKEELQREKDEQAAIILKENENDKY